MKRDTEHLFIWGSLFLTGLLALVAWIFFIWPQDRLAGAASQAREGLRSPSIAPLVSPTRRPDLEVRGPAKVTAVAAVSTSPRASADPPPRRIPPGVNLRAVSAIYLDVMERHAVALETLKGLLDADPEIKEVMAKKIQAVAPALEFLALADMFQDRTLRPMMLENLRVPEKFRANVEFGVAVVEGGEVNFRETTTPEQQADQFARASPLYHAQYQRLVTKLNLPAEYTDVLPDSLGGWRVKAILEEYMSEYGFHFEERQRQFVPGKSPPRPLFPPL